MNMQILFTFVGNRDPYTNPGEETPGPILSLLSVQSYDRIFLFCTGPRYFERARTVETIARDKEPNQKISFINIDLSSPIDYGEIYEHLWAAIEQQVLPALPGGKDNDISILLDPGTPQMQTVWFLLARSGQLPATLIQGIPPQFLGGVYKAKTVTLDNAVFPEILPFRQGEEISEVNEEEDKRYHYQTHAGTDPGGQWITGIKTRFLGSSPVFSKIVTDAERIAKYGDESVLLFGETGTGKNMVARLIHEKSGRRNKAFVPVNCSAISPTLVESEFFGHKKGSFTNAVDDRLGKFRTADGGTVFLDEIGDLPLDIQPKLLKVIEEKILSPVGEDKQYEVDVRIIAATNHSMEQLIREGTFRLDLYQRLKNIVITLPPLREREQDIVVLAEHFLQEWNRKYDEHKCFPGECWDVLTSYPWPGNVRELQHVVNSVCSQNTTNEIDPDLLTERLTSADSADGPATRNEKRPALPDIMDPGFDIKSALTAIEEDYYRKALELAEGSKQKAAQLLGINAPAFRKALRERFDIT
jgi:DNA-binding NtrC family response regulator